MARTVEHNQVWVHPDGTWSTMRRDGSENFVHINTIFRKILDTTPEPRTIEEEKP